MSDRLPGGRDETPDGTTVRWRALLDEATERLAAAGIEDPAVDARRLVEEASGAEGAELALALGEPATVGGVRRLDAMVARRLAGEPLQYVLGRWAFRHLDLMVDRRVLIPRPETEQVVEHALVELDRLAGRRPGGAVVVADLGTGSGAIGLSVAAERSRAEVWLTDASADALAVARANLAGIGRAGTRVRVAEGSWFEALPGTVRGQLDVVVANPPYVAADEHLPAEVRDWEPPGALVAGPSGLEALEHLVAEAPAWLAADGVLVVELAPHQAVAVAERAVDVGFAEAEVRPDLAGRDRAVVARLAPARR